MTNIESKKVEIHNSTDVIYNFLSDFNNFQDLMPEQVINWKSTKDTCSFTIKGMTDLAMKISERIPDRKVVMIPDGKTPLVYSLHSTLNTITADKCEAQITFEAELNPMMSMLATKPLQNFVNVLASKLKEKFDRG
jgi:hypothetical protein